MKKNLAKKKLILIFGCLFVCQETKTIGILEMFLCSALWPSIMYLKKTAAGKVVSTYIMIKIAQTSPGRAVISYPESLASCALKKRKDHIVNWVKNSTGLDFKNFKIESADSTESIKNLVKPNSTAYGNFSIPFPPSFEFSQTVIKNSLDEIDKKNNLNKQYENKDSKENIQNFEKTGNKSSVVNVSVDSKKFTYNDFQAMRAYCESYSEFFKTKANEQYWKGAATAGIGTALTITYLHSR